MARRAMTGDANSVGLNSSGKSLHSFEAPDNKSPHF